MATSLAVRNHNQSVAEFPNDWLECQLSPQTARSYFTDISMFREFLGCDLLQATRQDIYDYRSYLTEKVIGADGIAAPRYQIGTVNHKLTSVRMLYKEAVLRGLMAYDPTSGIRGYKTDSSYSSTLSPSKEQVQELLDSLRGDGLLECRDRAMLYVMATMGLRREEVANLTTGSIVEDGGKVALDVIGKGSKRRRLEVPATTMKALQAWIDAAQFGGDVPLFQSISATGGHHVTGNRLSPNGVYYVCLRRMDAVGLTGLSCHSLRHFLVTMLIEKGADIYAVSRLAGHSSTTTTSRYDRNRAGTCSSAHDLVDF